eukprot:Colp12_sorted_trinity150504_noHs@26042
MATKAATEFCECDFCELSTSKVKHFSETRFFACFVCGANFIDRHGLEKHCYIHPPYVCPTCHTEETSFADLAAHCEKVHNLKIQNKEEPHDTNITPKKENPLDLFKHKCSECGLQFRFYCGLKQHKQMRHSREPVKAKANLTTKMASKKVKAMSTIPVNDGEKSKANARDASEPAQTTSNPKSPTRTKASQKRQNGIKQEIDSVQSSGSSALGMKRKASEDVQKAYKCKFCAELYESKQLLLEHFEQVPAHKPQFKCSACKKRFYEEKKLQTHACAVAKKQRT